jgi:hypothetical protein
MVPHEYDVPSAEAGKLRPFTMIGEGQSGEPGQSGTDAFRP